MAERLAHALSPDGSYTGFDVSARAVAACRRRFAPLRPDFRFLHLDLANREYNAGGAASESAARFPAEDGAVDVALATSVFSHMQLQAIDAYLREAARVLAPNGRLLFTAYALTPERRAASGLQSFGARAQVLDPRSPERMIAHDEDALAEALASAGLRITYAARGTWGAGATYGDRQDLYVVTRG